MCPPSVCFLQSRAEAGYAPAGTSAQRGLCRRADMKRPALRPVFSLKTARARSVPGAGVLIGLLPGRLTLSLLPCHVALLRRLGLVRAVLLILHALVLCQLRLRLALSLVLVLTVHLVAHVFLRRFQGAPFGHAQYENVGRKVTLRLFRAEQQETAARFRRLRR